MARYAFRGTGPWSHSHPSVGQVAAASGRGLARERVRTALPHSTSENVPQDHPSLRGRTPETEGRWAARQLGINRLAVG